MDDTRKKIINEHVYKHHRYVEKVYPCHQVIFTALIGSQNYQLDSDKSCNRNCCRRANPHVHCLRTERDTDNSTACTNSSGCKDFQAKGSKEVSDRQVEEDQQEESQEDQENTDPVQYG